jgi:hypothetical protein
LDEYIAIRQFLNVYAEFVPGHIDTVFGDELLLVLAVLSRL